jgi:hypothetical protein
MGESPSRVVVKKKSSLNKGIVSPQSPNIKKINDER